MGRSAKLKGCGAVVEFFEAVFPRPGGPVLELALQHTLRRNPGPGQPPLPSQGHPSTLTRTHWEVLSSRHGRAMERSQQGDETISSSHSSCRNKSGPPWHLSPPVPPAGLLATCTHALPATRPSCLQLSCPLPFPGGVPEAGRAGGGVIDDSARVPLDSSSKFSYRVGSSMLKAAP